jgi:hypothetical protein
LFASVNKHLILNTPQNSPNPTGWSVFGGLVLCLNLGGCAAPLLALGGSATTAASSAGSVVVSAAVANPSTAASAISTVTTGKSPLEHAASAATKQDCNFLNALGPKPICSDIAVPKIKDMSESYLGPADRVPTAK